MGRLRYSTLVFILIVCARCVCGQQSPLLPEDRYNKLVNEVSGASAYQTIRHLSMYHSPSGGSQDFRDEAQWVLERAKEYGLAEVHYISLPMLSHASDVPTHDWTLKSGQLWLVAPQMIKLADVRETPLSVADDSPSVDLTAELLDVGDGSAEKDYSGKELTGKVVLAYGPLDQVKRLACWEHGAVAIVSYYSTRTDPWTEHPDQVAWGMSTPIEPGKKPVPVFMISPRTGLLLSRQMNGRSPEHIFAEVPDKPIVPAVFRVHVSIKSETSAPGTQGLVEGFIRGTTYHDQAIVLTAHLQEGQPSANDDRSGCANLLEIARALQAMIADGRLLRPKRDIRFWWTNEISAEYEYFLENPDERGKILVDINQDMVGALQSVGSRVQHVARTPFSRWSYLNDVVESIVTNLALGNNAYLASWENFNTVPYSRPIFAHLGSRDSYHAEIVPFFDETDHVAFNDSGIGIPGVTFTNWPDENIHSSDDDLWQVDRTQLQRNGIAVAAIALYIGDLGSSDLDQLIAVMQGAAQQRIAHDYQTGISRLASAAAPDRPAALQDAVWLVDAAVLREISGMNSLKRFASGTDRRLLDIAIEGAKQAGSQYRWEIEGWYKYLTAANSLPLLSDTERAAAARIPKNVGGPEEYIRHRRWFEAPHGLHPVMSFEALNYVDGNRSTLEIYHLVRSECLSAGEWYYGAVTLPDVDALFRAAAGAHVLEIFSRNVHPK